MLPHVLSNSVRCQFANMQLCLELPVCDDKENAMPVSPKENKRQSLFLQSQHHGISSFQGLVRLVNPGHSDTQLKDRLDGLPICDLIVHQHVLSSLSRARKFSNFDLSGAFRGKKIIRRAVRTIRNVG